MSLSRSQALQLRLSFTFGLLGAATERFFTRPDLPTVFPVYLLFLHQYMRASIPLMETACQVAKQAGRDPVCSGLADYFLRHIEEERNHDEWILEDLVSIGHSRAQMLGVPPSANVASLAGSQYYWILHHHPIALLGYIAILEGSAPSIWLSDRLQLQTGLPQSAFRTFRIHAAADPDHQIALDALIDELPLDDHHESLIAVSAAHTGASFAYCLADLQPWEGGRNIL